MKLQTLIAALSMITGLSGCAIRKDLPSAPFHPVNMAPIADGSNGDASDGTEYCKRAASGQFTEADVSPSVVTGSDAIATATGGGCVLRPIREVWAVLNNLDLMRFDSVDSYTASRTVHPTPDFTHLYSITYSKATAIGPINFTIDWYHGVGQGTFDNPSAVNIVYQRTHGTSMIPSWAGGFGLQKVNDHVTAIAIKNAFLARGLSTADNEFRAGSVITEVMRKARTGTPDWNGLNDGIESMPLPTPTPQPTATPVPPAS